MLTIDFNPLSRRDFLRVGALGVSGLTLADRLRGQSPESGMPGYVKDKAVVVLFLSGGPSQFETWDPKPNGVGSFTSINGHVATRLPGVRFSAYFPQMAQRADRLTIVRSLFAKTASHDQAVKNVLTGGLNPPESREGFPITRPSLAAVYSRARGMNHPRTGVPSAAVLPPVFDTVPGLRVGSVNPGVETALGGSEAGPLGASFRPLNPAAAGGFMDLLTPQIPEIRLSARQDLIGQLDAVNRRVDSSPALEQYDGITRRAFDTLRGGAIRNALDLSREDPRVRDRYDTRRYPIHNWSEHNHWVTSGPSAGFPLGRQMLMARRLVEAGCGFVTVVHSNWDMHGGRAIWGIRDGMDRFGPPLDHAVAAFLDDIRQRGLEDKILLIITGEFGRTGRINDSGGRDHNRNVSPLVLAGGGLRHGQVIGDSNDRGERAERSPVSIEDLTATVMNTIFDTDAMRLDRSINPHVRALAIDYGQPIPGLL